MRQKQHVCIFLTRVISSLYLSQFKSWLASLSLFCSIVIFRVTESRWARGRRRSISFFQMQSVFNLRIAWAELYSTVWYREYYSQESRPRNLKTFILFRTKCVNWIYSEIVIKFWHWRKLIHATYIRKLIENSWTEAGKKIVYLIQDVCA